MAKSARATGLQIAFLILAVNLVSTPFANRIAQSTDRIDRHTIGTALLLATGLVLIAMFPALRREALSFIRVRVPGERRLEALTVALAHAIALPLALGGAIALWLTITGGPAELQSWMQRHASDEAQMQAAFSTSGFVRMVVVGFLIAPFIEEIVFRGFLLQAWRRQWGWLASALLTSIVFALYHPIFPAAFLSSIVFISLLRRTGSIRAPMFAHAVFNLFLWYPLIGQFAFPGNSEDVGALSHWIPQLTALGLVTVAIPAYVIFAWRRPAPPQSENSNAS